MKKKLFVVALLSVLLFTFLYTSTSKEKVVSGILLDNIEALAADETAIPAWCIGVGSIDCPWSSAKVQRVFEGYR